MHFCAGVSISFDSLTEIPLVHEKDPGKKRILAIGPFGRRLAAVQPNSGETPPGSAGGRRVGDQGLTYDAPGAEGGSRTAPAGSVGGGGRRRPLRPTLRRGGDASRAWS
jgi:hypothetical protein